MSAAPSEGKPVAVVTGASSGIGLSVVNSLLARGFFVVATMRRVADAPAALVDAPHAVIRPLDVTSDDSVAALAEWLGDDRNVGRCDVLVNNAGFGVPGTVETVPLDTAMRVFDVNVWGVVRMCKAVLPIMRARGRGGLVLVVSSTSGVRSLPCTDFYAGSKFAVEGLMEAMRYSVAPDNIKVAIVNPGPVGTSFLNRYKREEAEMNSSDGKEAAILASKMSEHCTNVLAGRLADGQSKESCAESIVDVIEREYRKQIDRGQASVRFWNGTTASAENVIAAVKCDVTGCEGAVYRAIWKSSSEVADAVRREAGKE